MNIYPYSPVHGTSTNRDVMLLDGKTSHDKLMVQIEELKENDVVETQKLIFRGQIEYYPTMIRTQFTRNIFTQVRHIKCYLGGIIS